MHNVHKLCEKEQKMRFSGFFSTMVAWIDSLSHMMVVLNVSQHVAVAKLHPELIKDALCA